MLDTYGMRDPSIIEGLALSHHVPPTFGFTPRAGNNHGRPGGARERPTRERRNYGYLKA